MAPGPGLPEESEAEGREHHNSAYVHVQPLPNPKAEEQQVQTDWVLIAPSSLLAAEGRRDYHFGMDTRDFLRRYARGPLGIAGFFAGIAIALVSLVAGLGPIWAALALVAAPTLALVIALATGAGQSSASREGEREARERARLRMEAAAEARARLERLRLAPGPVAQARDLLVLEAGRLDEGFRRTGAWDPEAAEAVSEALSLVDAWQREADESAIERRFDEADKHPFPDADSRVAAALREKAALIAERRAAAEGEIPPVDRVAIDEELAR